MRDAWQVNRACLSTGGRRDPGQRYEAVRLVQVCDRPVVPKFLRQRVAVPDEEDGGGVRACGLVFGDVLPIAPACFLYLPGDAAAEGVIKIAGAVARLTATLFCTIREQTHRASLHGKDR